MPLNTQDFNTLVGNEITAAQASSNQLLDFSNGSVLLALIQANVSAVALWLQGLSSYILSLTRAASSNGADLDSWMADYNFIRLAATFATGSVTFSRFSNTVQAVVPLGAQIMTADGLSVYTVTIDTTNPNYSASLNGYVITAGTSSIDVPIQANVAGTQANSIIGAISIIVSPIPYVDTVTNASALTNATNVETDAAFRVRFVNYLASLSKATKLAIENAVQQVPGVTSYTLTENEDYDGTSDNGYFYIVVDDGTGNPSGGFLATVNGAVDAVRGFTIRFGIFGPSVLTANVTLTVTVASGYSHPVVAPIVQTAIETYINSLAIGQTLYYTKILQIAYDASPGVLDVSSYTLNSGTSDFAATNKQIIHPGTITVN